MDSHPSSSGGSALCATPSRAGLKAVEELRHEDLAPLRRPEDALRSVIARLQAANAAKKKELDWRDHYDALNEARRLVAHHADLVKGCSREFCLAALPALEMLRSSTVRNAMVLFQEMVPALGRAMDKVVEDVAPVMLKKAGEAATAGSGRDTFLVAEADKALSILMNTVSNSRAISTLLASASHKSMGIRCKVAGCLEEVLDPDIGRGQGPSQANLERVLKTAVGFTEEGAQDTRSYGKRIIWHVRQWVGSSAGFEKLLAKVGSETKQRKAREVLQARSMPPLPQRAHSRSQGHQSSSSPGITPTTPSLSPPSRTSSGGTGVDSVCSPPSTPEPRLNGNLSPVSSPPRRQNSGASVSKGRPPSADSVSSYPVDSTPVQSIRRDTGPRREPTPVRRQNSSASESTPSSPAADSVSSHPLSASPEPPPRRAVERKRVPPKPVRRQNSGASDVSSRMGSARGYASSASSEQASRRGAERRRAPTPIRRQNSFGSDPGTMPRTPKRASRPGYAGSLSPKGRMPAPVRRQGSAGQVPKPRPPTVIPREPQRQRSRTPPVRPGRWQQDEGAANGEAVGLDGALELMVSKDWRQRMTGLRAVAAAVETVPGESDAVVIPLMDTITQRLSDGNSKVIVVALETLKTLFSCAADDVSFHMNILVPALSNSLGSTSDKIRACTEEVIDQLVEVVDHILLIQNFSHCAANGHPKGRVLLLDKLQGIVTNVYPRKPQLVIKHTLPVAFKLMAESKADVRAANLKLLVALAELMGDQLFAYAGGMSLPSKMRLKEMIKSHGVDLESGSQDLGTAH
eukprot:evm.model.scf_708.2 EVM.evm.TU.scf_708.2   scf_708:36024-41849(+)